MLSDFDPDDPLAGLSSDEFDDLLDSDRPKSATKKPAAPILKAADTTAKPAEKVAPTGIVEFCILSRGVSCTLKI